MTKLELLKIAINRTLRIKKGMKHSIELRKASESKKLDEFTKARAKKKRQDVEKMIDQNMKDKGVGDVMLKRRDRNLRGRKKRGYIEKKLESNEEYLGPNPSKYFKKGGSVKAKCKLGRNKSTKLY
tara:strand:+ start:588 stop:965 length:378 start_codon:yes stop_codon:yes gene_type:complete